VNPAWPARACLAGLAYLVVALIAAPPAGANAPATIRLLVGLLAAAPLLTLLATRRRAGARWGTWVALVMIPYVTLSVGSWLVAPATRTQGVLFAVVASVVFFSGVFAARVAVSR
jgi:uncharacterized membrane protein YhaH (DUF805 family)